MQIPEGHVTPLFDNDYIPEQDRPVLAKWRLIATEWGLPRATAVLYRVFVGCGLLAQDSFASLRKTPLIDKRTIDSLVFWIPLIVPDSTAKTCKQQIKMLYKIRQKFGLPKHHMANFGQAALISCLLMYHQTTGGSALLKQDCVRTRNYTVIGGPRLCLGGNTGTSFQCFSPILDEHRDNRVGIFALGVEVIPGYMLPGGKK